MEAEMELGLSVAAQPSLEVITDQAKRAEELGYGRVWAPETWGRDAVTTLSAIAERTSDIGIGSSIMNVYSRSPALIGQTTATLDELSGGRMRVGMGPSGPAVIEGWHGEEFDRPLKRTREYVEIVKKVLSGEQVEYGGDLIDISGFKLRCDPPETPPPVDVAGMGPKAVELAGRFSDGWHAILFTPEGIKERHENLVEGAELGGRDPGDVRTMLSLTCCALEDGEKARDLARQHGAFYIGGMGTYYRDSLARQGYEDLAYEIHEKWWSGERDEAIDAISDDLLDDLCAAGTTEEARETLRKFGSIDEIDVIGVSFPRGAGNDKIVETMEALAPEKI